MSNKTLANAAIHGITDPNFETAPTYCERFFRQVSESVYGDKYADYYKASAKDTAFAFLDGPQDDYQIVLPAIAASLQPGDALFKVHGSGDFGHVGIYVGPTAHGPDCVAENSSTSIGRVDGAKGYRTLEEWGHIDVVVRFPDPNISPRLVVAKYLSDHWQYAALNGAQWDAAAHRWTVNQSTLGGFLGKAGAMVREPIRDAATALGWQVVDVSDKMSDANDPRFYVFLKP